MQLKIIHETIYQFDKPVFIEPHFLHFKPAGDHYLVLKDFKLNVSPQPIGLSEQADVENNTSHFCWFEGLHNELKITAESTVGTQPFNPFNHIVYPDTFLNVPFNYPDHLQDLLQPSLNGAELSPEIRNFLEEELRAVNGNTTSFIINLTRQIHKEFKVVNREEGIPFTPMETFQLRSGSCRDLTWMQIQCLRHLGIASRFVSGYFYLDLEEPSYELHAWVEAYIPGAGWLGFDPSHGIAVGHTHIPIAKSAHYENTMPVIGTVRGKGESNLNYTLRMEVVG